jgi:AraC family transcriptional regulator, transcriptional activator of pobA
MKTFNSIPLLDFSSPYPDDLPFEIGRIESMPPMARASFPHRHTFYEIIWITQGTGMHYIDFDEYPIQPGTLFFISPGEVHFMKLPSDIQGFTLLFTDDFFALVASTYQILNAVPFFVPGDHTACLRPTSTKGSDITQLFCHIEDEFQSTQLNRAQMLNAYLHILLITSSRIVHQSATLTNSPLTQAFLASLDTYFCQKKQVKDYADLLAVTPKYLNDVIKQNSGQTAGVLIRNRILLEAKRMLLHSNYSIADIAAHLQFDDLSYFCRFFKRLTGQSPAAFRIAIRRKYQLSS